jgi:hypothetical protein
MKSGCTDLRNTLDQCPQISSGIFSNADAGVGQMSAISRKKPTLQQENTVATTEKTRLRLGKMPANERKKSVLTTLEKETGKSAKADSLLENACL